MTNPVCAIVGAGEGLGAALSARFARGGFDIALVSRSTFQREAAAKEAREWNYTMRDDCK